MKLHQSLKFRFAVLFSVFIFVTVSLISWLGIQQMTAAVEETFSSQGIYIVERAASYINGDTFENLVRYGNDTYAYYEEIRLKLHELKEQTNVMYLYTMAPYDGDIWKFVIDGSAEPGHEDFSHFGDLDDVSEYDHAFQDAIELKKTVAGHLDNQGDWGWVVSVYTPILNSRGEVVGIAACDFDGEFLHSNIVEKRTQQLIVGGIALLLGLALMMFFLRQIFTPLQKLSSILHEISLGEGDLTRRADVAANEIGELASYFNMTLDKIKNLVVTIKDEAIYLQESGNDLALNMDSTAKAIHSITGNIQGVKQKVTSQSASVSQTHATMEQVTDNIDKLDKNVEAQTVSVTKSSAAIEEMLASIKSVTETLIRNAENVNELIQVSEMGHKSLQQVIQDIQEIARESEGLLEINAVMENISSQTNLLSMNAAIEAAHAGESGKGFAVVAGEIRKLANSSSDQSKTISIVLRKIKTAIDAITASTNTVLEQFQAIDERVRIVSEQEKNIRNAMEDQGQGSQQILQAISILNDQTQMVKQGSMEMLEGSKEVIQESNNLERVTVEISDGMNNMSNSAEEIDAAVNFVNGISKKTQDHIITLVREVAKFKVQ